MGGTRRSQNSLSLNKARRVVRCKPHPVGHRGDNLTMGDQDYDHFGDVQVVWALLGAAQDATNPADFVPQAPGLIAEETSQLGHADLAMVTASLQMFVLKHEADLLGRPPSDFAPAETGGEVLWRLTEARRFDTRERMLELAEESLIDAAQIIKVAVAQGMDIGHF